MNKKVMSFFVTIFFLFANFTCVFSADDVTPPVITGMTWSSAELHVGDILNIEIDASDAESGISTGDYDTSIFIKHSVSNVTKSALLFWDDTAKKLKGSITITSDMASGEWVLDFISIKDKANNRESYHQSDFTQMYKLNVIGTSSDVTPPVITGMTWSASELHVGDILNIEIDAYDAESGISTGDYDTSIFIKHSVSNVKKSAQLFFDDTAKKLKASITITSDMASGEWVLDFISIKDKANNRESYHQSDFTQMYKLVVIGTSSDVTPPVITGMTWSAAELQAGDILNIEIDASDAESGINTGDYDTSIFIKHSASNVTKSALLFWDDTAQKLKGSITITSDMASGEWVLDFVSITDKANNRESYHQSDFTQQYKISIKSVFSGTENTSIPVGTNFDPLSGVKAVSSWEGDFTDKITYTGDIDTNTQGIYLIKYEAVGRSGTTYKNYRWITVVSNPTYYDTEGIQGTFFNKEISLRLSNLFDQSSIAIVKDGASYSIGSNWIISEEGSYRISFVSSGVQSNSEQPLFKASSTTLNGVDADSQPSDLEFTIDKTSPQILEYYPQTIDEGTKISADKFVKASDNNGILIYEYLSEPVWNKVGDQDIQVIVKDLAGNQVTQQAKLTIIDKCDLDRDGKVSIIDLASAAKNYNVKSTQMNWNPRLDFNKDNITDIFDLVTISKRLK